MAQAEVYNSTWASAVRAAVNRGRLSHAVILTGEGDKLSPARYIAAAHLCRSEGQRPCLQCNACRKVMEGIHPDVTEVRDDDRKELAVDTIRALRQDVYIRPNEGERKVYLFTDCAQLNERDQNVLLKIVEEGPAYAAFVFCADTLHALLAVCGRSGSCGEGAEALRSVFDRRQLQALTDLFRRYCSECQYNVGVGHVLGALNAELTDILTL